MTTSNKVYDSVKNFAMVHLPGLGTLYFALATIWGMPHSEKVVGSIIALDAFLGVGLKVSSLAYKAPVDGKIVVDKTDPVKDIYRLELDTPVDEIDKKDTVTLAVTPPKTTS